jgi:hypothetical protein
MFADNHEATVRTDGLPVLATATILGHGLLLIVGLDVASCGTIQPV